VCNSSGSGGASSLVLPSSGTVNISSANLVYVYLVAGNNPSLITVSDGVNTWTPMSANVGGYTVNGYYAQNATGSSTYSLTITYNTTTNGFAACMIAFSGALTTGALYSQGTVTYSSGTTSFSSASVTPPSGHREVVVAGWVGACCNNLTSVSMNQSFTVAAYTPLTAGLSNAVIGYLIEPAGGTAATPMTTLGASQNGSTMNVVFSGH
jgi:hypothetical protein